LGTQVGNIDAFVTALENPDHVNHMIRNIMECPH